MKKLLLSLLLIFLLAAAGAGALYLYAGRYYVAPGPLTQSAIVDIPSGTGFKKIANILADSSVISQPELFMGKVFLLQKQRAFKAGEYAFEPGITPEQVVEKLVKGDVIVHSITIPEGLTSAEILHLLATEEALTGDLPARVEEGVLLPETYHYVRGDSRRSVLMRMYNAMSETLRTLWEARRDGLPLSTPDDAAILASIVEKETGLADERPRVAAVFLNRLVTGMKLQSDPTVIYGILQATGKKPTRLLKKDLKTPTPYNTYVIPALPPSPIANPGKASIAAVLQAPVTDELYFVADGTGGHRFARSLKAHNENVRQWKRIRARTP